MKMPHSCEDCKICRYDNDYDFAFCPFIRDGVTRFVNERHPKCPLKEPKQGEWIPIRWDDEKTKCKLREYPFDGKRVIVTDGKNISVERIKIDALDHFSPAGRWFELEDVIAWMPLPESYQKEGKSE
jgi:hypothetical protein